MSVYWLEQTIADVPSENDWLSLHEAGCLAEMRIAKRRQDWRLGRWTAKQAIAACLGRPALPRSLNAIEVRAMPGGAPLAFIENAVAPLEISLSHRQGRAACAVASAGVALGCDLEVVEPHSDAFIADYLSRQEQAWLAMVPADDQVRAVALLWSAKESALKALHVGLRLDTRCVVVRHVEPPAGNGWSRLQVVYDEWRIFEGWWLEGAGFLRTLVADPPSCAPIGLGSPACLLDCA